MSQVPTLFAYLCDNISCKAMEGDLIRTADIYSLSVQFRDGALFRDHTLAQRKGLLPEITEHQNLLSSINWDGELPAFVLSAPMLIEGQQVQAFGGEGWPAFCREMRIRTYGE